MVLGTDGPLLQRNFLFTTSLSKESVVSGLDKMSIGIGLETLVDRKLANSL